MRKLKLWQRPVSPTAKQMAHNGTPSYSSDLKQKPSSSLALPEASIASAAHRLPTWATIEGLQCPSHLSLQQCSSEATAMYKAEVVRRLFPQGGAAMVDLTGGLGVDFSALAPHFEHATYVEQRPELCAAMRHNAPLLGLRHIDIVEGNSTEYLEHMLPVDLIFIDPARRDTTGRKTVYIEDCEPNVTQLLPLLQAKARHTLVKLSPMLDVHRAVQTLRSVAEIHIVGAQNECKELLLLLTPDAQNPRIVCAEGNHRFAFTAEEEAAATATLTATPLSYLYEPNATLMKAGAFKLVAQRFGLQKFHPNTHLYTSQQPIENFPGRAFRILRTGGFGKRALRDFKGDCTQANLTVRNFPASVAELRKKLKLKEGGSEYWFATTLADNSHVLIACEKISPPHSTSAE